MINSNLELKNMFGQFMKINIASSSSSGTLPSNTITNPKEDLKGITTRSGNPYQGPTIPTTFSSLPKVVERETEVIKDTVPPTNNGSTKDVQPLVVQIETLKPNSEPTVALVVEPVVAPVSALKRNQKPSIPYPYRLHDQKLRDKANDQKEKIFQIFQDLNFNISFVDALILMTKFGSTIKSLLSNKYKLYELARTPLNEHCSAVLFKKLPKKLGDSGKFLILCDFPGMDECLALADLGVSINLIPLSVWNKLSLPKLTPTLMTLKLVDRSISRPIDVAEDVFVKVGKFHFPADFVVVDFDVDPPVTFNLDQTLRYSTNYNDMTANRIDGIDMACEEYSQEVLSFFNVITSGNATPYYDPIVSTSSPTLTPFGDSDFLLEEVDAFLALEDDPTSPENDTIQQVQNSCQFHGLPGDDANKHLHKFLHVTQSIKVNEVTNYAFCLYLFLNSLIRHATAWFDRLPRNSINTFEQMAKMFLGRYFSPSMVTKLRNEITNFCQRPNESLFEAWNRYKLLIYRCPNHNMLPVTQIDTFYNGLTLRHRDTINAAAGGTFMKRGLKECYDQIKIMTAHHNDWDTLAHPSESSSSITSSPDPKIVALKAEMAKINKKSHESSSD
nr:reverse transcriptase domain-containing protein [Tanacetum cinerariifolium]